MKTLLTESSTFNEKIFFLMQIDLMENFFIIKSLP